MFTMFGFVTTVNYQNFRARHDVRKYFFACRHIEVWNCESTNINPYRIMRQKIEIMRFVQVKLCLKNIELCAKLCISNDKKLSFSLHFTFISSTFFILNVN